MTKYLVFYFVPTFYEVEIEASSKEESMENF